MSDPKLCYILMGVPKYRDVSPEEEVSRDILKNIMGSNTKICTCFEACSTSPTWCPMSACFSN